MECIGRARPVSKGACKSRVTPAFANGHYNRDSKGQTGRGKLMEVGCGGGSGLSRRLEGKVVSWVAPKYQLDLRGGMAATQR